MPSARSHSNETQHGLSLSGVADPSAMVEYAIAAEDAGWDGVFLIDHLIDFTDASGDDPHDLYDPWTAMAAIATETEQLTLGSSITPIPRRQPWQFAKTLATLDRLSDGRVLLGAGLGAPREFEPFGQEYDQERLAAKYDEALEVITGLWTGEPFSYDGDFFTIEEAVMRPTPVQEPRIPIVIGGWWPFKAPFRRAARWDGIVPNWPSMHCNAPYLEYYPEHMREIIPEEPRHEREVEEMVAYYRKLADDPGEIILSTGSPTAPEGFARFCRDLGATWLIHSPIESEGDRGENVARISEGPPL